MATQSCQVMVKAPLIEVGEHSAAKTAVVEALIPIPAPRRRRQASSCCQFCVNAEPRTEPKEKIAETKIVPRRPTRLFRGSETQHPLDTAVSPHPTFPKKGGSDQVEEGFTYNKKMAKVGAELTSPRIHLSSEELLAIPNSLGKDKLAPLLPVLTQLVSETLVT